jgi:hypothetical protein
LLAEGRLPECWIPPGHILECRALLETYHDLRREHTAQAQRIHAVLFHQGAPALGEGTLRTGQGVAARRAAAAAHLSPAGQLQVATALEVIDALDTRLHVLRHQLDPCSSSPTAEAGRPPPTGNAIAATAGVPLDHHALLAMAKATSVGYIPIPLLSPLRYDPAVPLLASWRLA